MIALEESAESYTLRSADLEISFRHVGDRWQHSISVQRHGAVCHLMTSDEGTPRGLVLPSPALQDLRLEKLSDEVYEFQLLGQAGKEVYSAAIRLNGASGAIDFDLCARRRSIDAPLCTASRYRLDDADDSLSLQSHENRWLVLLRGERALEFAPVPIPEHADSQCRICREGPARRLAAGHFGKLGSDTAHKGVSLRWQYRISLSHS